MIETPPNLRMQAEIKEFYSCLDEGSNSMAEAGARESRVGVPQVEIMVEAGSRESNVGTPIVTGNSANTSKSKVTGHGVCYQ